MIQIKDDNLKDICIKYTVQMHLALKKRCDNVTTLKKILTTTPLITTWENNVLHYKSAIAIINLTKFKIDDKVGGKKIIHHLKNNLSELTIELPQIETDLQKILKKIKGDKLIESASIKLIGLNSGFKKNAFSKNLTEFLFNYNDYRTVLDNYLAKPLGVNVCPYCNRNFISFLPQDGDETSDKKVIGPTYDHFFHKNEYKFLSLSFYNLVPSCYVCNSNLKGTKKFHHQRNINPFVEGFDNDAYFDFELSPDETNSKINFTPILNEKIGIDIDRRTRIFGNNSNDDSGNVRVFKIKEIYAMHYDTVEEIYMNFDKNNRYYSASIKDELEKIGSNEAEFYRFHFKNYFDEKDFNKRPLAKLSKDIYNKMKEINDLI